MGRFAARVFGYTLGATLLWWLTRSTTAVWSIDAAKLLHRLVGAPAPFLILECLDYWWLAPPVQLFVGLTLAASWLTWRRRIMALVVGVLLLWFLVILDVVSMSSPYLGPSPMRGVLDSILTNGHLIIAPIIFWLILVGLPATPLLQGNTPEASLHTRAPAMTPHKWWPRLLLAGLICSALSFAVYVPAWTATQKVKQTRRAMAEALRVGDDRLSILHALELGKIQRQNTKKDDQCLYYLIGRLGERYGNRQLADKFLFNPAVNPRVQAAIRKQRLRNRPILRPAPVSNPSAADSSPNTTAPSPTQQPPAEARR